MTRFDINSLLQFYNPKMIVDVDINWCGFLANQAEILWLYTEMEIKAQEQSMRTGKPISEETQRRVDTLKRHHAWLAQLLAMFDKLQGECDELHRQNEYLKNKSPKIDFKEMIQVYENGKLLFRKRKVGEKYFIKDYINENINRLRREPNSL